MCDSGAASEASCMKYGRQQPAQRFPIFFLNDDFIVNRKTGMMPVSHIFHQAVADAIISLHHGKDLFTKYDSCLVTVDSRKRMKTAGKVKHAVGDQPSCAG